LYATDVKEYDRGYYFDFKDLPYPLAQSQEEFLEILKNFNLEKYRKDVEDFENNKIGMFEDGNASKNIAQWMVDHRL
jgi:CDP-glycerol glycerophosphotransferase